MDSAAARCPSGRCLPSWREPSNPQERTARSLRRGIDTRPARRTGYGWPAYPVEATLELIGGKWQGIGLDDLPGGRLRFSVKREIGCVTLVKGALRGIVRAVRLSRATMRNVKQNLFFALAYNAAGVPVAAGLLYPVTGRLLSPMFAAAAMSLSSVSVIANALRLRRG